MMSIVIFIAMLGIRSDKPDLSFAELCSAIEEKTGDTLSHDDKNRVARVLSYLISAGFMVARIDPEGERYHSSVTGHVYAETIRGVVAFMAKVEDLDDGEDIPF